MANDLHTQSCVPCKSGEPPLSLKEATEHLAQVPGWEFDDDKKAIFKTFKMKDFLAAVGLIQALAQIAEKEDHHPDIHLTAYRDLKIELSTHAIDGLSKNDFILAAKIENLPKELKA